MKDIKPNPHLNKWLAGALVVLAGLPLYLGVHSLTFLRVEDWGWSASSLAIGFLILAGAVWAWFSPPINAARILFTEGGFQIETKQVFRARKSVNLQWAEIDEIIKFEGGFYGGRSLRIKHAGGQLLFASAWTDTDMLEMIRRFTASAEAAGFTLEKETGFWRGLLRERWIVKRQV